MAMQHDVFRIYVSCIDPYIIASGESMDKNSGYYGIHNKGGMFLRSIRCIYHGVVIGFLLLKT
ncbi:MAG: hypothetical protein ACR5K4_03535 [Sodalis sp. (in: enterobacteria)]